LFRILVGVLVMSMVAGGLITFQMLRSIPEERAEARRDAYQGRLSALDDLIPELGLVAELITDPDEEGIVQGIVTIIQLDNRASGLHTIASEPLPGIPALAPSGPVDELAEVQNLILTIVDRSETISRRLSDIISYRQAFERAFRLPALPLTAAGPIVDEVAGEFETMLDDSVEAAANLPDDEFFREHLAEVDALIDWLAGWQDDYMAALRTGDSEGAGTLVTEARRRVDLIRVDIETPLADARGWSEQAVGELGREVDEALALSD
jgi:hypothetical protein